MSSTESNENTSTTPPTRPFRATGPTRGHCAGAGSEELGAVPGVDAVEVEVVSGGESIVRVSTSRELGVDEVAAALAEAGDYTLVDA